MKQTTIYIVAGFFLLAFTVKAQTNFIGAPNASEPGAYNIIIGLRSGQVIAQNGWYNTFVGFQTGQNTTTGAQNAFLGSQSGQANTTGASNVFSRSCCRFCQFDRLG